MKLSASQECGMTKIGHGFIFGGNESAPGQWPWLASLFYKDNYHCGSSIISKKHLLSAAHCIHTKQEIERRLPSDFYALLGHHDLDNKNEPGSVRKQISQLFMHPDWDTLKRSYDADIAVFVMDSDVAFTTLIQPICVPNLGTNVFDIEGTVAGYGLSENSENHEPRPKHVKIKSISQADCLFMEHRFATISSKNMFCGGMQGKNPCRGDSGSPFMVQSNGHWTINGIVSSAVDRECKNNKYVLFTQVPVYIVWIQSITGISTVDTDVLRDDHPLKCDYSYEDDHNSFVCRFEFQVTDRNTKITSVQGRISDPEYNFDSVETMVKNGRQISYLPDFSVVAQKFPNLKRFFIVNAGLKELEKSKMESMYKFKQLRHFNIFGNDVSAFQEDIFDGFENLEDLAFVSNRVKVLPKKLLWNLPKLKEFWAWDNQIEAIPPRFFKNNLKIEKIWLQSNKIASIGIVIRSLPNLRVLDLSSNVCINKSAHNNFEALQSEIDEKC